MLERGAITVQGAAAALQLLAACEEERCEGGQNLCKQLIRSLTRQLEDTAEALRNVAKHMPTG